MSTLRSHYLGIERKAQYGASIQQWDKLATHFFTVQFLLPEYGEAEGGVIDR
jgi:hypothetical protein